MNTGRKLAIPPPPPELILHNWVWRGLLCMNLKRNLTQIQNNSLCCHAWATLHCSRHRVLWLRHGTEYSDVPLRAAPRAMPAFDWPHSTTISQNHIFPPQSLSSNKEHRRYGRLIVIEKKERGGGDGGREKPLTSLSISPSFLTLSVCSITPSFGKRQRSKTERDERKTELSSDS